MKTKSKSCNEMLELIQKDCDVITNKIDLFYSENSGKEDIKMLMTKNFSLDIIEFNSKYASIYAGVTDENTNTFLGIDFDCSSKIDAKVSYLANYINSFE